MISKQKKLNQSRNSGFTLVEIILTISLISIISTIIIPTYSYINEKKNTLELEQKAMMLKNGFKKVLSDGQNGSTYENYPIRSVQSTNTINYVNIPDKSFYHFCNYLIHNSNVIENDFTSRSIFHNEFNYNQCISIVKYVFKTGEKIDFEFIVYDDQISYNDYGYLIAFTYYTNKNESKYIKI